MERVEVLEEELFKMVDEKFIVNKLQNEIKTKEQLYDFWKRIPGLCTKTLEDEHYFEPTDVQFQLMKRYLYLAMGGEDVKYFDISEDPETAYFQFEAMFLSFNWEYGRELEKAGLVPNNKIFASYMATCEQVQIFASSVVNFRHTISNAEDIEELKNVLKKELATTDMWKSLTFTNHWTSNNPVTIVVLNWRRMETPE